MRRTILIAGVALGLAAGTAKAGERAVVFPDGNVKIDLASRYAYGPVSSARNSSNNVEHIVASVFAYASGNRVAQLTFKDAANTFASCTTTVPAIVDTIASVQGDSDVYATWDSGGKCSIVMVHQDSAYGPKAP
jgi:hypothetical protein